MTQGVQRLLAGAPRSPVMRRVDRGFCRDFSCLLAGSELATSIPSSRPRSGIEQKGE